VDFADLVAVAQHYDDVSGLRTREEGDVSGADGIPDGNVTFADLVAVAQTYGEKQSAQTFPAPADRVATTYTANQSIPFAIEFFNETAAASVELHRVKLNEDGSVESDEIVPQEDMAPPDVSPSPITLSASSATIDEGQSVSVSLSAPTGTSVDPIQSWVIHAASDVTIAGNPSTASVPFTDAGVFDVTAEAIGQSGLHYDATGAFTVTVNNVAPTVSIDTPSATSVDEGDDVSLHATASDAGADDVLTYEWNVTKERNPFITGEGEYFDFAPDDQGDYVATVTVTDSHDISDTDSVEITAANVAAAGGGGGGEKGG
jgi:hypothetical protein